MVIDLSVFSFVLRSFEHRIDGLHQPIRKQRIKSSHTPYVGSVVYTHALCVALCDEQHAVCTLSVYALPSGSKGP